MRKLLIGVALALGCSMASADVIIGNLGDISGGGTLFGSSATTIYKAAGFTMGSDPYYLDSVTLTIASATAGSTAHVQIWEGAGAPSSMIADLTSFSFPEVTVPTDFSWTPGSQLELSANTTYWLYLDNIFNTGDSWVWDSGSTTPTGAGATHVGYIFNGSSSSFMNTYQLDGTIVPEPGCAVLFLVGAVAMLRRR